MVALCGEDSEGASEGASTNLFSSLSGVDMTELVGTISGKTADGRWWTISKSFSLCLMLPSLICYTRFKPPILPLCAKTDKTLVLRYAFTVQDQFSCTKIHKNTGNS